MKKLTSCLTSCLLASNIYAYDVLDNGYLRFGTGAENSLTSQGLLEQPFYYKEDGSTKKLTYYNYDLRMAFGVGGDGTNDWNTNGTLNISGGYGYTAYTVESSSADYSGFTKVDDSHGYGSIVWTGIIDIGGTDLEVTNTYTLTQGESFVKINTKVKNISGETIENLRIWVGTEDDWIENSDSNRKERGNFLDGEFVKVTNASEQAKVVKVSNNDAGVYFYSTAEKADTIIGSGYSWGRLLPQAPSSTIETYGDNSYAVYMKLENLANGASEEIDTYYAGGALANLESIGSAVATASVVGKSVSEDGSVTFAGDFKDPNNVTFTKIKITQLPQHGTLKLNGVAVTLNQVIDATDSDYANLVYEPDANYVGTDTFTWQGWDTASSQYLDVSSVNLVLSNTNDAPTSSDEEFTIVEENSKVFASSDFAFNDIDPDDAMEKLYIVSLPNNGKLTYNDANITENFEIATANISNLKFTPETNEVGSPYTTFDFRVNDGDLNSSVQTATINVTNTNDVPLLEGIADEFKNEDFNEFNITIYPSDFDGDNLRLTVDVNDTSLLTLPANSTDWIPQEMYQNGLPLTINPQANRYGVVELNVTVQDPSGASSVETFNITVSPQDDKPVAMSMVASVGPGSENLFSNFTPMFNDIDDTCDMMGLPIQCPERLRIESLPDINKGYFTKTDDNWNTEQNITAVPFEVSMMELGSYKFVAKDGVSGPTDVNWSIRTVGDMSENGWSNTAVGTVTIVAPENNNAPDLNITDGTSNIQDTIVQMNEDSNITIYANFSDDWTPSQFILGNIESNNTNLVDPSDFIYDNTQANKSDGNVAITVIPKPNAYGDVNISFEAMDGDKSTKKSVVLSINSVNDAPTAFSFEKTISEDSQYGFNTLNPTTVYQDSHDSALAAMEAYPDVFKIVTLPTNGKLFLGEDEITTENFDINISSLASLKYVPTANYFGSDTFTWKAYDGALWTDVKNATVNVTSVNDLPVVSTSDVTEVQEDGLYTYTLNATDLETNNLLNWNVVSKPYWLTYENGVLSGTPGNSDVGEHTISFSITDGEDIVEHNFTITVENTNDAPTITILDENGTRSDIVTKDEDFDSFVLNINGDDMDGDNLRFSVDTNDSTIISLPAVETDWMTQAQYSSALPLPISSIPNKYGSVELSITAEDTSGEKIVKHITITVSPINDAPKVLAISDVYVYRNSSSKSINLDITDVDNNSSNLIYGATFTNSNLVSDINFSENNMTVYFTDNESGSSEVNVTIGDGEFNSSKVFTFNVLALQENDSVKTNGDVQVDENSTVRVRFEDDNITVTAPTKSNNDGSTFHEIDFGTVKVKATSEVNGSVVEVTENGVHTLFEDVNNSLKAEVNATITGEAMHTLDLNGTKTIAQSKIIGAQTIIKDVNGSIEIETTVTNDTNTTFKVTAKESGYATHVVELPNGKVSQATAKVMGANTIITEDNKVETKVAKESVEATVLTNEDGTNTLEFVVGGSTIKALAEGSSFEANSSATIEDINGSLQITIEAPLTQPLQF